MDLAQGTVVLVFATAVISFLTVTTKFVLIPVWRALKAAEKAYEIVTRELTNGDPVDGDDYKGFRDEVKQRFDEGGEWMRSHESLPADAAHGGRRPPP